MDGNSLQCLTQKYTTETLENTTHAVTVKRGFRAIQEELTKREERQNMIREVRDSNVLLRAPRPSPQELKEGK